jgi:outer membrane receptor protein involved in Fe transport
VGPSQAEGIFKQGYSYMYTQNQMMLNQLNGEHFLTKTKLKINWELSRANTSRSMPDYKNVEYRGNSAERLELGVTSSANENAARLFTDLNEQLQTAGGSVTIPIAKMNKSSFKVGAFHQYKDRTFDARMLGFARARNVGFNLALLDLPIDQVFNYDNMNMQGFRLNDITNPSHKYTANSTLNAGYIMAENRIGARTKVIWGARYEAYNQQLVSATRNNDTVDINANFNDLLPSINIVYSLNATSNIRASASKTVSRPELRELAPFSFYDFSSASSLEGNDKLQRAIIQNYDIRYEIYPGVGQVFSVALFYKDFTNPIELVLANDISLGVIRRSFVNLPRASSLGAEFDFRVDLTKKFTTFGNFSYIQSVINPGDNINKWNENRPMQGQSPYIINLGLLYKFEKINMSISGLYNIYGDRIYNVGNTSYPDIYERARHQVDLQLTKSFFKKKLEAKIGVSDVFANDLVFYMDYNKTSSYEAGDDVSIFRFKMPRIITFSLGYKF